MAKVDQTASANFRRQLAQLSKKHPNAERDLQDAFDRIEKDPLRECQAAVVPGWGGDLIKYRCASTDMRKGASGGFRILVFHDQREGLLYPISVYRKADMEQPPVGDVCRWLAEVQKLPGESERA